MTPTHSRPVRGGGVLLWLAKLLLKGTGHVAMPRRLSDDMRAATWMAQFERRRTKSVPEAPPGRAGECAYERVIDPDQRVQDALAYAAMIDFVEGRLTVEYTPTKDPRHDP
jgi:hypothetical protein